MDAKVCTKCLVERPIDQYHINRGRKRHICKVCVAEYSRAYYRLNRDDTLMSRKRRQLAKYDLTPEEYMKMLKDQDNSCVICLTRLPITWENRRHAHVDHCHSTGDVRGLLCSGCNRGLGLFKDNPTALIRAAEYITNNRTKSDNTCLGL